MGVPHLNQALHCKVNIKWLFHYAVPLSPTCASLCMSYKYDVTLNN